MVESFETVDRDSLDCVLGRLGLFVMYTSPSIREVRLRFKLAAALGVAWTRDGSISQGCRLSMVFIVALCAPWFRHLESLKGVTPKLYADNLKCTSFYVDFLLAAAVTRSLMLELWVRRLLPVCAYYSAHPGLCAGA